MPEKVKLTGFADTAGNRLVLQERVEKASATDRGIDWKIACDLDHAHMLNLVEIFEGKKAVRYARKGTSAALAQIDFEDGTRDLSSITPPNYTLSLDDAIALVERVLPGWSVTVRAFRGPGHCGDAFLAQWASPCAEVAHYNAPTVPLAILSALLRALAANKED